MYVKIHNFGQKSAFDYTPNFQSKIQILIKKSNFGQK